jgi:hypothetical protein
MEKKPYVSPVVTEHGDAVKLTKGGGGTAFELFTLREGPPPPPPGGDGGPTQL